MNVKVKEGNRERVQAYEGVVIAKKNAGLNSAFTVRKISHGTGVERVFQSHSPAIDSVTVKRRGKVRGAKLYYLRGLEGKKARITEGPQQARWGRVSFYRRDRNRSREYRLGALSRVCAPRPKRPSATTAALSMRVLFP